MDRNSMIAILLITLVILIIIITVAIIMSNRTTPASVSEDDTDPPKTFDHSPVETFVSSVKKILKSVESFDSRRYKELSSTEKLGNLVKENSLIAILAPWCGHCKRLKESKLLEEVSKKIPVFVINDKHPETPVLMGEVGSNGFPSLIVFKDKMIKNYEGDRNLDDILKMFT